MDHCVDSSTIIDARLNSSLPHVFLSSASDICEGCLQSRQQAQVLESHTFSSAKIYIRHIDAEDTPTSQQLDQSTPTTDHDMLDQSVLSTNSHLTNGSAAEDNDSSQVRDSSL